MNIPKLRVRGNNRNCRYARVRAFVDRLCLLSFPRRDDARYPEHKPNGAPGSAQPEQAGVCRRPLPPVAEEEARVLLYPKS